MTEQRMTHEEATSAGRSLRKSVPRSSHGDWTAAPDRPDPVELVEGQNADRLDWLLPVRRARMSESAFAFYRGGARIMATDLASTPVVGLNAQLCGDAHLSNFGAYASPERRLVFDVNDFDETLPGPFEWDVKRLAASFTIAGQHLGFDRKTCRSLSAEAARTYRTTMADLADQGWLETFYSHVAVADLIATARSRGLSKQARKRGQRFARKAKSKDHLRAAGKLTERADGRYRFKSQPPLLVPFREIPRAADPNALRASIDEALEEYRATLTERTRRLYDRYELIDMAVKVVGVGSVGTRCSVALLMGRDPDDVLLIQVKEATRSVLEEHLPASRFRLHGRRVVEGQRAMQASSDIFLGWCTSNQGRHYYLRQLKDWKGSVDTERGTPDDHRRYARLCGWILARAHAVSGDPAAIAGYLGSGKVFDEAMAEFSERYAEQNAADYEAFTTAIRDGRLSASESIEG